MLSMDVVKFITGYRSISLKMHLTVSFKIIRRIHKVFGTSSVILYIIKYLQITYFFLNSLFKIVQFQMRVDVMLCYDSSGIDYWSQQFLRGNLDSDPVVRR